MRGRPSPAWVDLAWWEVLGAELRAEHMTREAWIDTLALAWCLVRRPESLDPVQLEQQQDMADRLMGRKYLTTIPGPEWPKYPTTIPRPEWPNEDTITVITRGINPINPGNLR